MNEVVALMLFLDFSPLLFISRPVWLWVLLPRNWEVFLTVLRTCSLEWLAFRISSSSSEDTSASSTMFSLSCWWWCTTLCVITANYSRFWVCLSFFRFNKERTVFGSVLNIEMSFSFSWFNWLEIKWISYSMRCPTASLSKLEAFARCRN